MIDSKRIFRLLLLVVVLGALCFLTYQLRFIFYAIDIREILPIITSVSATLGFAAFFYLNNSKQTATKMDNTSGYAELLREKADNPKKDKDDNEIDEQIADANARNMDVDDESTANEIKHTFLASEDRIKEEIQNLKRRATINLSLGVALSCAALLVFFFLIYNEKLGNNYTEVLLHFLPRIGLVIFVELLAYFFLQLYKTSLVSIQNYHNELTNIESKKIAAIVAIKHCAEEKIWEATEYLFKVERNVLLKDKETTSQMEMLKMQADKDKTTLSSLQSLLKKVVNKL